MVQCILIANSKMKIIFLFALMIQISRSIENCKKSVDDYEKLIKEGIEESKNFKLPTSAKEFKPKSDSIAVIDVGSYDFVIVGAGTTGSVIASRLSEIKEWSILLIEAGDMPSNFSLIPRMTKYLYSSKYNWNYQTTVQKNACLGEKDHRCGVLRGKMFGGTSGIDSSMFKRGNVKDYDRWAEKGNGGWGFKDVLPYFLKLENCQIDGDANYHGKGGQWNTKWYNRPNIRLDKLMSAYEELYTCNPIDYNGKDQLGLFLTQFSETRNIKNNAAHRYLNLKRKNLDIKLNAFVTKILINSKTKTAYGVEYASGGKLYRVLTRKEVILSAGSISSPKLLLLSGVGPSQLLKDLNIHVVSDLPVGKTVFSHPFHELTISTNVSTPSDDLREQIKNYLNMFGDLITPYGNYGTGYFQSSKNNDPGCPDIEFVFKTPLLYGDCTTDPYNASSSLLDVKYNMKVSLMYLNSESVGSIFVNSNDPYEYPQIDVNIYNSTNDLDGMYEGIQILKKLLDTNALKNINASILYDNYKECQNYTPESLDYWHCAFKLYTYFINLSGSCKMGSDPKSSVVDRNGAVHGIKKLKVADASIIPLSITARLTATCLMIGEKISDIIKLRYGKKIDPINLIFD